MQTTVLTRGPANFNMCGQLLGYPLKTVADTISAGLAKRLHAYALKRLAEAGFQRAVEGWAVEVYTLDGNERPADRSYCVRFQNLEGGYIELVGILTNMGWPCFDHRFSIGHEEHKAIAGN